MNERRVKARDVSFDITWRDGAYHVSIPKVNHETVVLLATAEAIEAENAGLRDELRKAMNVIRTLIIEAGGSVTISDYSVAEAYGKELIAYRDESMRHHKLSVK